MSEQGRKVGAAIVPPRARKLLAGLLAGGAVALLFAAAAWVRPGLLEEGEYWTYDWRARRSAAEQAASEQIVVVDIDEQDLGKVAETYGVRWPWPRELFGYLVQFASRGGARAVVLDWVFEEPSSVPDMTALADSFSANGRTVFGLSMPLQLPAPRQTAEGRWAAPLKRFGTRAEADRAALLLRNWNLRGYVLPEGAGFALWYGAGDAQGALEGWSRLRGGELPALLLPEGADSLPEEPPAPRELTEAEAAGERTVLGLLRERDGLALDAPPGVRFSSRQIVPPQPLLASGAARLGNVLQFGERDGTIRRYELFVEHGGRLYPSLAMSALMVGEGVAPRFEGGALVLGERRFELDAEGKVPIRFTRRDYSRLHAFKLLDAMTQLEAGEKPELDPKVLAGKYVVVAPTAVALGDLRVTPIARAHLGAEINANVLDNLLRGQQLRRASPAADALFTLGLALLLSLAVLAAGALTRSALASLGATVVALGLGLGGAALLGDWLFDAHGLWLALATPALGAVAATFVSMLAASAFERRDRRFVQEALGRYTSPVLVRELMAHPEYLSLEWGEVREISVYFSDIAGFTNFSEALEPKRLVALLNDYLTNMTDLVLEHGGVVDKYIGDAIMAFWGAPLPEPEHARKAVLAALAMRRRCEQLQSKWEKEYGVKVVARAGINTGRAVSGNMGSRHKFNYTVMGDTVNLASRLEGANKPYGTTLMISESCLAGCRDAVEVRELDLLAVKGKQQPVTVYEVLAEKGRLEEGFVAVLEHYGEGLRRYRARDFAGAQESFRAALALRPEDGPSQTYLQRCEYFRENPPPAAWDGVWRMKEK